MLDRDNINVKLTISSYKVCSLVNNVYGSLVRKTTATDVSVSKQTKKQTISTCIYMY